MPTATRPEDRARRTPEEIAYAAGVSFLNSKVDRLPDENELGDLCELAAGDDSLAVVRACVPVAEAVKWIVECRRKTRDVAPASAPTEFECISSMREMAKKRAARKL